MGAHHRRARKPRNHGGRQRVGPEPGRVLATARTQGPDPAIQLPPGLGGRGPRWRGGRGKLSSVDSRSAEILQGQSEDFYLISKLSNKFKRKEHPSLCLSYSLLLSPSATLFLYLTLISPSLSYSLSLLALCLCLCLYLNLLLSLSLSYFPSLPLSLSRSSERSLKRFEAIAVLFLWRFLVQLRCGWISNLSERSKLLKNFSSFLVLRLCGSKVKM